MNSEGSRDAATSCPVCGRPVAALRVPANAVRELAAVNCPDWDPDSGFCGDCERRFVAAYDLLSQAHDPLGRGFARILPTPLRLGAADAPTGRGVTIAFLDSGFYAHPDLVQPDNRILRYVDVTDPSARRGDLSTPDVSSWHGMMTSVVACGNGRLSKGLYRGLASEAEVVLVKCGSARRVVHDDIRRGIDWVIRHRKRYRIRIVNISVGGDYAASYLDDELSQSVERATRMGILVCAAAGNLGERAEVLPPASAPSALTVGGLDDRNRLRFASYGMYHSSFGPTLDGLQKPEVIAPGIWVAAPILPGTETADRARLLSDLKHTADSRLADRVRAHAGVDERLDAVRNAPATTIRTVVEQSLRDDNVISAHYKHVDGTSFASPIVASQAARILEVRPDLTPQQVKLALIRTARRIAGVPVDRQGWGVVDPEAALAAARSWPKARSVPGGS